jgi:hypothetical protein
MKLSSDALTFNEKLEVALLLQREELASDAEEPLPSKPAEIERFENEVRNLGELRLPAGQRKAHALYLELSMQAQMWIVSDSLRRQRECPFEHSELQLHLESEVWKPRDALLVLSGLNPTTAIVEWSYESYMGATIEKPQLRRANWFSNHRDIYDYPLLSDFERSPAALRNEIRRAQKRGEQERVAQLEQELEEVTTWEKDPTSIYLADMLALRQEMLRCISRRWFSSDHDPDQKHSPEFFVRWAEARGFEIEWAIWAREHGLIDKDSPATEPPYFDADGEDYPELLHIAVRAWEHARTTARGTPKKRIVDFVSERYPHISKGARDAIALVTNWQKEGGRPTTGG